MVRMTTQLVSLVFIMSVTGNTLAGPITKRWYSDLANCPRPEWKTAILSLPAQLRELDSKTETEEMGWIIDTLLRPEGTTEPVVISALTSIFHDPETAHKLPVPLYERSLLNPRRWPVTRDVAVNAIRALASHPDQSRAAQLLLKTADWLNPNHEASRYSTISFKAFLGDAGAEAILESIASMATRANPTRSCQLTWGTIARLTDRK